MSNTIYPTLITLVVWFGCGGYAIVNKDGDYIAVAVLLSFLVWLIYASLS